MLYRQSVLFISFKRTNIMDYLHTGFTVRSKEEIKSFYSDILNMDMIRNFQLDGKLSKLLFNVNREIDVYQMQKDEVMFEVFIYEEMITPVINHICMALENRELAAQRANEKNYKVVRIKREKNDLIFIYDKDGNIFEIKESL